MSTAIRIKALNKVFKLDKQKTPFEALKNIDLEIEKGKVTGIIGPNGAGKSTLLKILSGITYPDSGTAEIDGTISSLLEVGTGFHPELTGKENIFLNGSILGMKRREIQDKFDDIVEFSGVEKFINTPVKHYSSGMYVRLAFSVAAHLNSDILLIDEVLAVGDAEFQKKCLDRMDQVSHSDNRTIVFVSHNMNAARNLCDEIIYLDEGTVKMKGKPEDVIRHYLSSLQESSNSQSLADRTDRKGNGEVRFTGLQFIDPNDADAEVVLSTGGKATLKVDYTSDSKTEFINYLSIRISVYNNFGNYLTTLSNELTETISKAPSSGSLYCHLDRLPFMPGRYYVKANIYQGQVQTDGVDHALTFDVQEGDFYQSGNTYSRKVPGIFVEQEWGRSRGQ